MRYTKANPRLTVQFVNADTDEILFVVKDRTWLTVGELLNDVAVDSIMKHEYKKTPPENLMVLVAAEYSLK